MKKKAKVRIDTIKIRLIKRSDVRALRDIWINKKIINFTNGDSSLTVKETAKKLINPNNRVFVACFRDLAVGFARIEIFKKKRNHSGEIGIFLHPDYHGIGIGSMLMKTLIFEANKKRLKRIQLCVNTDNKKAIGLYKKFGFVKEGRLKKSIQRGRTLTDLFIMAKLL